MRVAGTWVAAHTPVILNPAKSVLPGQSAELSFTLENQSVYDSILGLDLTVKTDDPWIQDYFHGPRGRAAGRRPRGAIR